MNHNTFTFMSIKEDMQSTADFPNKMFMMNKEWKSSNKMKRNATTQTDDQSSEPQNVGTDKKIDDIIMTAKQFCTGMNEKIKISSNLLFNVVAILKNIKNVQKESMEELENYRTQLSSLSEKLNKPAQKFDKLNESAKYQVNNKKCNDELKHKIVSLVRQELSSLRVNNQTQQDDEKTRDVKRCENNLTTFMIRKQLYDLKYIPDEESSSDFCNKFEDIIFNYKNISGGTAISEEEKRDIFYNAIMTTVPEIQPIEFMMKKTTGKGLSYDQLKMFLIQDEANMRQIKSTETRTALVVKCDPKVRCYACDDYGHLSYDCPQKGSGLRKCYECYQFTTHKADECPQRFERQKQRCVSRNGSYTRENNRYEYIKNSRSNEQFNDRRQSQKRQNNDHMPGNNFKKSKNETKELN